MQFAVCNLLMWSPKNKKKITAYFLIALERYNE